MSTYNHLSRVLMVSLLVFSAVLVSRIRGQYSSGGMAGGLQQTSSPYYNSLLQLLRPGTPTGLLSPRSIVYNQQRLAYLSMLQRSAQGGLRPPVAFPSMYNLPFNGAQMQQYGGQNPALLGNTFAQQNTFSQQRPPNFPQQNAQFPQQRPPTFAQQNNQFAQQRPSTYGYSQYQG